MTQQTRRFLRLKQVMEMVGLGRSAIYAKIKKGEFPESILIGERAVAWNSIDVESWIDGRIRACKSDVAENGGQ